MAIISPLPYNIANGQAIDTTPVMADLNQIVSNVNANAAPLAGSPTQVFNVANATTATEAVNLGQFEQKGIYSASQSGSIAIANSTSYSVASVGVTFPSFSKTGAFRVRTVLIMAGNATAAGAANNFAASITDGTNTQSGADWLIYVPASGYGWSVSDAVNLAATYSPGSAVTFTFKATTSGGSTSFTIAGCTMQLWVEEA